MIEKPFYDVKTLYGFMKSAYKSTLNWTMNNESTQKYFAQMNNFCGKIVSNLRLISFDRP